MSVERTYHHGSLRTELLKAALVLLDQDGLEAVTVRAVARKAKVAHSAPANHFTNRATLLRSVAALLFEELDLSIEKGLAASKSDLRSQLQAFAVSVERYADKHPHRYRLLWRRDVMGEDQALDKAGAAIYERLFQVLGQQNFAESMRRDYDADTYVIAFWSLVHGYIVLRLDGTLVPQVDTVAQVKRLEAMIDLLIRASAL